MLISTPLGASGQSPVAAVSTIAGSWGSLGIRLGTPVVGEPLKVAAKDGASAPVVIQIEIFPYFRAKL